MFERLGVSRVVGLTRLLEQVWYGSVEADDTRYAEALEHLKSLGCPSH